MMSLSSIPVVFFVQAYGDLFNKNPYFEKRVKINKERCRKGWQ
jgi:hypothetical protein